METIPKIRIDFIGMLFALAIGEIGIEMANLFLLKHQIAEPLFTFLYKTAHIFLHLLLGLVIVTFSWVGWQKSESLGNTSVIDSIFSMPFVILLIDVLIVIAYFTLIKGAGDAKLIDQTNSSIPPPEVNHETLWSMVIFILYLMWDVFTDIFEVEYKKYQKHKGEEKGEDAYYKKIHTIHIGNFIRRNWQTLICCTIAILIYWFFRKEGNPNRVILIDLMLINLFVLFRAWKQKLHKTYKLGRQQIPEQLIVKSHLIEFFKERPEAKIEVKDQEFFYWLKFLSIKVFPLIFGIVLLILYFMLN